MSGKLYLVPTPIGNLRDMTFRAVDILNAVDLILAEDTRTSSVLLRHYGIEKPVKAFHKFNEHKMLEKVMNDLSAGMQIAYITDAGMPGISDPGFLLVREAVERNIPVEVLPGASAFVTALAGSGLPSERFVFEGFLPVKKGRQTRLQKLAGEERTMVFYESPHRLAKTLTQLAESLGGDRKAVVARELTKKFEEYRRGTLDELVRYYTEHPPKGEIVLVVEGAGKKKSKN